MGCSFAAAMASTAARQNQQPVSVPAARCPCCRAYHSAACLVVSMEALEASCHPGSCRRAPALRSSGMPDSRLLGAGVQGHFLRWASGAGGLNSWCGPQRHVLCCQLSARGCCNLGLDILQVTTGRHRVVFPHIWASGASVGLQESWRGDGLMWAGCCAGRWFNHVVTGLASTALLLPQAAPAGNSCLTAWQCLPAPP